MLVPSGQGAEVVEIARDVGPLSTVVVTATSEGHDLVVINTELGDTERLIDELARHISFESESSSAVLTLLSVEATLPKRPSEIATDKEDRAAREELREELDALSRPTTRFFVMIALSALVASLGLVLDDTAVVIGAMVIAPLLGPIVAFAFGVVAADRGLMETGIRTELAGIALAIAVAAILGWLVPEQTLEASRQVQLRTEPNLLSLVLALAAGTAGALSLTAAINTTLVGVMVAVALLPPAAILGLALGAWKAVLIRGAGLLLITNVASILLAGILTLRLTGIRPGKWWEFSKAERSTRRVALAVVLFLVLVSTALVPPTVNAVRELSLTSRLSAVVQDWAPPMVVGQTLEIDLKQQPSEITIELRTTVDPNVLKLNELGSALQKELPEARFVIRVQPYAQVEFEPGGQ